MRTLGQRYDQHDFEEIVVLSSSDGTIVRLGDIAEVRDDFQDIDLIVRRQNQPAAFVEVFRVEGEQVMDVATAVQEHVAEVIIPSPSLPNGVSVTIWNDDSQTYSERVDLLLKNGGLGLLLVFVALALFLEIRLALWVTVGLAISFVGALAVRLAQRLTSRSTPSRCSCLSLPSASSSTMPLWSPNTSTWNARRERRASSRRSAARDGIFVNYDIGELITITAGLDNVFDEEPPNFHSAFNAETDPGTYDTIGRRFFTAIAVRF